MGTTTSTRIRRRYTGRSANRCAYEESLPYCTRLSDARAVERRSDGVIENDGSQLRGLTRVRRLWRLWRNERDEPEPFYSLLAQEATRKLDRKYGPVSGQVIADLGCGPGYYARAFRALGATVIPMDGSTDELEGAGSAPRARWLPTPVVSRCALRASTACSARTCSNMRPTPTRSSRRSNGCCDRAGGRTCRGPTGTHRGVAMT